MNREIHRICLAGITGVERHKAIDIISAAIAMQYHKNVLVINEGYASDAAIEQIPASIKVFVVCGENKQASDHVIQQEQPADIVVIDGEIFDNGQANEVNKSQIERGIASVVGDAVKRGTTILE